ncbi:hypothetical protein AVEN_217727-1 [Araneus ventricosus]|uniref:Uncharacterized protein n=1 Tax=Araneus ventricosus TaxID=182803 RepID=A0A4Y2NMQ7_ARAVE|nr:hypothetical protein AVEN_217727-1 [Araneus ventricosus]
MQSGGYFTKKFAKCSWFQEKVRKIEMKDEEARMGCIQKTTNWYLEDGRKLVVFAYLSLIKVSFIPHCSMEWSKNCSIDEGEEEEAAWGASQRLN